MVTLIKKFLIMCSGANQEILRRPECAIEYNKYIGIGATILLTAIIAFLSSSYALYLALQSKTLSLLLGLLFSLIIFNLDRYLVLTLKRKIIPPNLSLTERTRRRSSEIYAVIPRLILAIFISIVISIPVELKLFEREIESEIERHIKSEIIGLSAMVLNEFPEINRLNAENEKLKQEIEFKQKQVDDLQQLMIAKGGLPSSSEALNERKKAFLRAENELYELRKVNQEKIEANNEKLKYLQSQADSRIKEANEKIELSRGGLFTRLEALNALKSERETIALASLFLLILFILLLTSPVLVKLLSNVGPYEHFWAAIESMALNSERNPATVDASEEISASSADEETARMKPNSEQQNESEGSSAQAKKVSPRHLKVFLCHSSHDKPMIRELYRQLQADDIDPWLDEENILPGQDWSQEISKAVRLCDVVIICLSRGVVSKTGYIQKEIRFALEVAAEQPEGAIFLIPAKIEECEIPTALRQLQWVNLFEKTGYKKLLTALHKRALSVGAIINAKA